MYRFSIKTINQKGTPKNHQTVPQIWVPAYGSASSQSKIITTRGNKMFSIQREIYTYTLFFASSLLVSRRFCKGCSFSSPPKARRCGLQGRTSKPQRLEGCAAGFRVSRSQVRLGNHHTQKTKTKLKPEIARLLSINSRHRRTSLQSQTPDRLTPVARPL